MCYHAVAFNKILSSKTELLLYIKKEDQYSMVQIIPINSPEEVEADTISLAYDIWRLIGKPHYFKFEEIQEVWKGCIKND